MTTLKERVLQFLYKQVSENKIPMIRKGMVEDLEQFITHELSDAEMRRSINKMTKPTIDVTLETKGKVDGFADVSFTPTEAQDEENS